MSRIRDNLFIDLAADSDYQDQRQIPSAPILGWSQQQSSRQIQVDQSTGHKQPVGVLVQPPVTNLVETKDPFENQKWMFNFCPHPRFGSVLGLVCIAQWAVSV